MVYTCTYPSPLGNILLAADEVGLTGLWFEGQKYFGNTLPKEAVSQEIPVLIRAKKWLDVYFSGKEPDFTPALHPAGSTFRQAVWQILLQIPYGQTMTYGEIAKKMTQMHDAPHMSAQAVGSAVDITKFHYHSLSSCCRDKWQSHRICRGNGKEGRAVKTGTYRYEWFLCSQKGNCALSES